MGMTSALSTAIMGLNLSKAGLELVSRNVANAGTDGYTRKSLVQENLAAQGAGIGVRQVTVTREVDSFLRTQLQTELSIAGQSHVEAEFMQRLDLLYGQPGSSSSLDTRVNAFTNALQELASAPEVEVNRDAVLAQADQLANQINTLSQNIQQMRQDAESGIAQAVSDANEILQEISDLNTSIQAQWQSTSGSGDLEDRRDALIYRLSELIDVNVSEGERGAMRVFTSNGDLLVDAEASRLSFDEHGSIGPQSEFSNLESERGVGTIVLTSSNGGTVDIVKGRQQSFSGQIAGYLTMRDEILVEAQAQLDELAHGLALALSSKEVAGTAVTSGAQDGFDLDLSGLQSGNPVTITYTESGTAKQVTFIRVDDPATLPLDDAQTPNPNDTVVGIDFSGGNAAAAAAMSAALGAAITVTDEGGNVMRFLDDGAAATVDIDAVRAGITATTLADDGTQLPLFTDTGNRPYSAALDGLDQKVGFAARIQVNGDVMADTSWLVTYETIPVTGAGDSTRPLDLMQRLTEAMFEFSPDSGIGSTRAPYSGTIDAFARRVVSAQTGRAEVANQKFEAQSVVVGAIQERIDSKSAVDVDEEMAMLLELQTAYSSNARVITTIKEMMQMLLNM